MKKKKRKRGLPWTGLLLTVVILLALCVAAAGYRLFRREKAEDRRKETVQTAAGQTEHGLKPDSWEYAEDGTEIKDSEKPTAEFGTENPEKYETEQNPKTEDQTETTNDILIEVESMSETESEDDTLSAGETETESQKLTVAIDPGHQGSWVDMSDLEPSAPGSTEMKAKATTGTEGRFSGKKEFELNLEVSLLLKEELENRGYEVIMTREDNDTAISNSERALKAYEEGGDIYVRIHANGADDASVDGALAMVPSSGNQYVGYLADDSYLLADCILRAYCDKASFNSLGIQYYDNMTGINWSKLPVMILEMGFMTNELDDLRMADPSVQVLMAEGIADGIDEYFQQKGIKKQKVSAENQARVDAALEILGEDYIYPAQDAGETWAVSLISLTTGARGALNGDVQMKSASVIKVFLMAAIYDRVCYPSQEERRLYINENYEGELKQLLTDMITVSDNDAANTLLERLGGGDASAGMAVVNQFCEENGYTGTSIGRKFLEQNPEGDNYTTADDCSRLLTEIYNGTCVCREASAKMYEYLKNQQRVNKIPAGLQGTTAVAANKTGELAGDYGDYVENDIAVIEDGRNVWVLSILSKNVKDNRAAIEKIAAMTKSIYENL